jgi:hypothetical protein
MSLLAGVVLFSWPAPAGAAAIGFQNNLKMNIFVEAVSIVGKRVIRDKPLLLTPGKVGWHLNVPAGTRVIAIYDANPPLRMLHRVTIPVNTPKLFFAVQPLQPIRGVPRATLVPAKPPKGGMGR